MRLLVDAKLPMFVNNTLRSMINILLNIALIAAVLPWFLLVVPVAGAIYLVLYVVFRVGIRTSQRFQLESMAPLLTHVDASVHGLSSVHAYQQVDDFQRRSVTHVCDRFYRATAKHYMVLVAVCPSVCQTRVLRQNEIIVCKYVNTVR